MMRDNILPITRGETECYWTEPLITKNNHTKHNHYHNISSVCCIAFVNLIFLNIHLNALNSNHTAILHMFIVFIYNTRGATRRSRGISRGNKGLQCHKTDL
eukprot:248402_1